MQCVISLDSGGWCALCLLRTVSFLCLFPLTLFRRQPPRESRLKSLRTRFHSAFLGASSVSLSLPLHALSLSLSLPSFSLTLIMCLSITSPPSMKITISVNHIFSTTDGAEDTCFFKERGRVTRTLFANLAPTRQVQIQCTYSLLVTTNRDILSNA